MKRKQLFLLAILLSLAASMGCAVPGQKDTKPAEIAVVNTSGQSSPKEINRYDFARPNGDSEIAMLVTFLNPLGEEKKGYLSFELWLNNDKIDLANFPMDRNAKLYDLNGNLISAQPEWETEGKRPHVIGKIHFPLNFELSKNNGLKLVIENLGTTPKRDFTWDKKYLTL